MAEEKIKIRLKDGLGYFAVGAPRFFLSLTAEDELEVDEAVYKMYLKGHTEKVTKSTKKREKKTGDEAACSVPQKP